jgi:hypothetical protein
MRLQQYNRNHHASGQGKSGVEGADARLMLSPKLRVALEAPWTSTDVVHEGISVGQANSAPCQIPQICAGRALSCVGLREVCFKQRGDALQQLPLLTGSKALTWIHHFHGADASLRARFFWVADSSSRAC